MDGISGLAGWQWIFVLEGILTVFSGGAAFFFIYDSPDAVSWLTKEEKKYVKLKLAYDGSVGGNATEEEGSKKKYAKDAFSDRLVSSRTLLLFLVAAFLKTNLFDRSTSA